MSDNEQKPADTKPAEGGSEHVNLKVFLDEKNLFSRT